MFDNWNTSACKMTDTAIFTLESSLRVDRVEVWYQWQTREKSIRYSFLKDGQTLYSGVLNRSECDPYQEKWRVAVDGFDLMLDSGTYIIHTERPRICQNQESDTNGFVKVYGERQ